MEPDDGQTVILASLKERIMFGWAIFFLLVALGAAFLGYGGVAALSLEFAKIVFWIALVLLAISLIVGLVSRRRPPPV